MIEGEPPSGASAVPGSCSPLFLRPLARPTLLPPESSSSSCSIPSILSLAVPRSERLARVGVADHSGKPQETGWAGWAGWLASCRMPFAGPVAMPTRAMTPGPHPALSAPSLSSPFRPARARRTGSTRGACAALSAFAAAASSAPVRWRAEAMSGSETQSFPAKLYLRRMSRTRSSGIASTVRPRAVTDVAMKSEL